MVRKKTGRPFEHCFIKSKRAKGWVMNKRCGQPHCDDFYIIYTRFKNDAPRYMLSRIYLSKYYLGSFDYKPKTTEDGRGKTSEVNHIAINGDVALAVTQFHCWGVPDNGGISEIGRQTMWIAERREGIWKWKSAIVGFENFREWRPGPQPTEDGE